METVERDYAPKGVVFYYIYKPLAHPEYNNYVSPVTIEERLMHVAEAKRVLGTSINWLADTMDNVFHDAMGKTANSELVIDPDGVVVARRLWSDPKELRQDLERLIGPVASPTQVADLNLPTQPPAPTVAKGIVPRLQKPAGRWWPLEIEAVVEGADLPFYVKIRAEGDSGLLADGNGKLYLGFHLDPLYGVHWNNEAGPVEFQLKAPPGLTVSPASGVGPEVEEPADADPREFLVDVAAQSLTLPLELNVFYYACDDALTFCIPVNQSYRITLARNESHGSSIQTSADGPMLAEGGRGGTRGEGGARRMPNIDSFDADGDGRISLAEAPPQMQGRFDLWDANGDGFISAREFRVNPWAAVPEPR